MKNSSSFFKVSVDTGGTFTDSVIYGKNIGLLSGKALTDNNDAFSGVKNAISESLKDKEISFSELLKKTDTLVYGTTRATNAVITNKVAKTAFITTKGFKDTLVLKEGGKHKAHDFSKKYPNPFIPKKFTFEINERICSEGKVVLPLNKEEVEETINKISSLGFESISVSLLWSIANPIHEVEIGNIISKVNSKITFSLSHKLVPIIREYRRASTTSIDASLKPIMQNHLKDLNHKLIHEGFKGKLFVSTSSGGWSEIENIIKNPIYTLKSGPSMAPVAAKEFGNLETNHKDFIVCDSGGTTFDIGLIQNNEIKKSRDTWIGEKWTGDISSISSVNIESIGSGGGSIAWIDNGGLLRLGPNSAGSYPGPACYDLGGSKPTLSDAACVLGYLNPDFFLEGNIKLNIKKAEKAIKPLSKKINKTIQETAFGIVELASETMTNAVRNITDA